MYAHIWNAKIYPTEKRKCYAVKMDYNKRKKEKNLINSQLIFENRLTKVGPTFPANPEKDDAKRKSFIFVKYCRYWI